mgnify:CR=1 FL=1|jgi:predicted transcriptional regulator
MLYEQVKIQGRKISEIARETGMSRNTIKNTFAGMNKNTKQRDRKGPQSWIRSRLILTS